MSYFNKYKFDKSKFRLGMRTFKTGLAVFIILLLFGLFGWKGLQIGALTAVFSLREDFDKSVHFGTSRILGNSIGGFYALLFLKYSLPSLFLLKIRLHHRHKVSALFCENYPALWFDKPVHLTLHNKSQPDP